MRFRDVLCVGDREREREYEYGARYLPYLHDLL